MTTHAPVYEPLFIKAEIQLIVADYIDEITTAEDAFDLLQNSGDDILKLAYPNVTFQEVTFLEFDSTNPSHACAFFDCTIEGTEEQLTTYGLLIDDEQIIER